MKQKQVFKTIFILLALLLPVLPFIVSFNDVLTKLVERFALYTWMQDQLVPIQVKLVTLLVSLLGVGVTATTSGFIVNNTYLEMTWNCLGWQSIFLLIITLIVGLKSNEHTLMSRLESLAIAVLGTFMINMLRLTFIVILFSVSRPVYAVVYHDYLAAIVTILWLVFFWWFAYGYILEEKGEGLRVKGEVSSE